MENTTLSLKDVINNMMDALQRTQERLKELGEVSPDLPGVTDDMLLIDDMEKSIDECESLYERMNSAMVFATYAGQKTVALQRDGQVDPFEFGPDCFEMREKYWDWANEFGVWPEDEYYEELQRFFEKKMEGLVENPIIAVSEKSYFDIHVIYGPGDGDGYSVFVELDGHAGEQDAVDKAVEDCFFQEPEDIGKIDYVAKIDKLQYYECAGKEMPVDSWEEMQKKYSMEREDMDEEVEKRFVEDCYKLYEKEGFSSVYWSPFADYADRKGQKIEVIGRCTTENRDLCTLPMWEVRFPDGETVEAHPEEVIPSEMRANGCELFDAKKPAVDSLIAKAKEKQQDVPLQDDKQIDKELSL